MKARKTHYLISTHQISGVYNSPFYPPNPSAKELELRNARPLSHRSRQRLRSQLPSDAAEILNHTREIRTLSRESRSAPLPPISMKSTGKVQVRKLFDYLMLTKLKGDLDGTIFAYNYRMGHAYAIPTTQIVSYKSNLQHPYDSCTQHVVTGNLISWKSYTIFPWCQQWVP